MGAVAAIDGAAQGKLGPQAVRWRVEGIALSKSAPLLVDGRLYCVDDAAKLHVLDAKTGKALSRRIPMGTAMESSPLYADGKIYVFTKSGRWCILRPDSRGAEILNRGQMPAGEECQASPVCSHGRLFVQTTGALYCLADAKKQSGSQARPQTAGEAVAGEDSQPAHVLVVPAELMLKPGGQQAFKVRLYNGRGQLLREAEAAFELQGPGTISPQGLYQAPAESAHTATVVHVKVGELRGTARIRVIPDLPWTFDFTGLNEPPITWIGARYRHVIRNVEGNDMIVKITTIPKGTRSRSWFGPSDLHDYTIQADVRGGIQDKKMPDIGLIAQGYTLDLLGESQKLQIRMWDSQLNRMGTTMDFPWQPDTWYIMKFQVSTQGSRAVTRGKVWPQGQPEPQAWTIEAADEAPNAAGSPGLWGSSTNAEIFLDNILVATNANNG